MKKLKLLGKGKWGTVYKGCYNKKCLYKYARKNSNNLDNEYKLMKAVHTVAPHGVVKPFSYTSGKNEEMNMLFMQYLDLNNKKKKITMKNLKKLIREIIITIQKIQKVYPSFRHNDLHWDNVFNTKNNKEVLIGDFGFANINKQGLRNPIVTSGEFKVEWGIFPNNNKNYDIQLLLNSIHSRGTLEVKKFIETLVPKYYLGSETEYIFQSRMRYNINHKNFPSVKEIFSKLIV